MASKDQFLPPKENAVFKTIVKFYTLKQYKKGIKAADQVLKIFPNHGETLAMKGLILNCLEKKAEAYEFVRKGLKCNINSHVCWHTYGLLYRSDRNYLEAIKCYRNALRHDKDNMQILRDLSLLQIQMRDLVGYMETRRQILVLKPNQRNAWVAFSMAAHLLKNYEKALNILGSYENTLPEDARSGFEYSETLLYKNSLLEESGQLQLALEHLDQAEPHVIDKQTLQERRAQLLHRLNRYQDAEKVLLTLLSANPDNIKWHNALIAARLHTDPQIGRSALNDADDEARNSLAALYEKLAKDFPKCIAIRRIPLDFLKGTAFRDALAAYIRADLRKGVPSLFTGLKALYNDKEKREILGSVIVDTHQSLLADLRFPYTEADSKKEAPSTQLWAKFLLAQHYDRIGAHAQALATAEEGIAHTPTVIELYILKAKILKHAGDVQGAWAAYDHARTMDLADRCINTKATLYALRADKVEVAEKTIALFTSKEGADPQETLFEMQCMWYETECGRSHLRTGKHGRALKKLLAVDKHFADITEDQFDFHTYCLRKMTLRTYIQMLRLEDDLYGHKYYQEAARTAIQVYLTLYDTPATPAKAESQADNKTEQQQRREKKKADEKKEKLAKQQAEQDAKNKKPAAKVDADPEGAQLISGDLLAEANKLLRQLLRYAPKDVANNLLAFKVFIRKKKLLLALQSLYRVHAAAPEHPGLFAAIVELALAAFSPAATTPASSSTTPTTTSSSSTTTTTTTTTTNTAPVVDETVTRVLNQALMKLLHEQTPLAFFERELSRHASSSYGHLVSALRAAHVLGAPERVRDVAARLAAALNTATLRQAQDALSELRHYGTEKEVEAFVAAAHAQFPLANVFAPPAPVPPPSEAAPDAAPSTSAQ